MSQQVKVRLLAKAAEIAGASEVSVKTNAATPLALISELARENPGLAENILRGDGKPRSSTRVLINGKPPLSLEERIDAGADVAVVVALPCDG